MDSRRSSNELNIASQRFRRLIESATGSHQSIARSRLDVRGRIVKRSVSVGGAVRRRTCELVAAIRHGENGVFEGLVFIDTPTQLDCMPGGLFQKEARVRAFS